MRSLSNKKFGIPIALNLLRNINVFYKSRKELDNLCGKDEVSHQGLIAEVEHLVEPGELHPNEIHTPGIFVQRIFQGERYEKRIEQRTVRQKP